MNNSSCARLTHHTHYACTCICCSHAGAYDNVKALVSAEAIPLLLDAARGFEEESATLSPVYLALKQLAANDESVKLVSCLALSLACIFGLL